jgi:hypothetical protein
VLPISPGGLGVIEGVLIPSLVGFGAARSVALLGVVSWRLFNFWAPIPVAGLCYVSMRAQDWTGKIGPGRVWAAFKAFFEGDPAAPGQPDAKEIVVPDPTGPVSH